MESTYTGGSLPSTRSLASANPTELVHSATTSWPGGIWPLKRLQKECLSRPQRTFLPLRKVKVAHRVSYSSPTQFEAPDSHRLCLLNIQKGLISACAGLLPLRRSNDYLTPFLLPPFNWKVQLCSFDFFSVNQWQPVEAAAAGPQGQAGQSGSSRDPFFFPPPRPVL